jgi:DNA polymerase V
MPDNNVVALVDCNNFYVSCERVFNPKLEGAPVAVLSNNDGVIIARSNEVKALGIKMGAPVFKCRDILNKHNVKLFSSNFVLYGDMSERVMKTLKQFTPDIEIYSIDEAFLSFNSMQNINFKEYAREIRNTVKKWTGIPVSIGVAQTKTLAKAANELAKKNPEFNGVLDFTRLNEKQTDSCLKRLPVEDLWGVGRRLAPVLRARGILTALEMKHAPDRWVKKHLTIQGLRMVHELRGIPCIELEKMTPPQKSVSTTRSFGRPVESFAILKKAVSTFAVRASEKLREQNQKASCLQVFIHTNRFEQGGDMYFNSSSSKLPDPSSDACEIVKASVSLLEKIYKKGFLYKKAGVILTGLTPEDNIQLDIFGSYQKQNKSQQLMKAMDNINTKFGRDCCTVAAAGIKKSSWGMRQLKKSKRFTTAWHELIIAKL